MAFPGTILLSSTEDHLILMRLGLENERQKVMADACQVIHAILGNMHFAPAYLNTCIWHMLFGHAYLETCILTLHFAHVYFRPCILDMQISDRYMHFGGYRAVAGKKVITITIENHHV